MVRINGSGKEPLNVKFNSNSDQNAYLNPKQSRSIFGDGYKVVHTQGENYSTGEKFPIKKIYDSNGELIQENWDTDNNGKDDSIVTYKKNDAGNTIITHYELDETGKKSNIVIQEQNSNGDVLSESTDKDANGKPEVTVKREFVNGKWKSNYTFGETPS